MRSGNRLKAALVGVGIASSIMASGAFASSVPTAGLVLGLDASQNLTPPSSGTVTMWGDINGGANRVASVIGTPTVTTIATPNGSHAAINFDGLSGLVLNDAAALSLQNLSIFVIGNLTPSGSIHNSDEFITDYHNNGSSNGWATGISDHTPMQNGPLDPGTPNQPKWFTGPDGADALGGTTGATLVPGTAASNTYLLVNSINGGTKNADAYNGVGGTIIDQHSTSDTVAGIPYDTHEVAAIGVLDAFVPAGLQHLTGNIAEVLVYNNAAPGYNQQSVLNSLYNEYGVPEPSSLALLSLGGLAALRRRRQA